MGNKTKKDMDQIRIEGLAKFLEVEPEDLNASRFDDQAINYGNAEYVVLTDSEADANAATYIKETLWAFNAEFIIDNSKLPYEAVEMVRSFQQKKCEDANGTIAAIIDDMPAFIDAAISADGRGHFLSQYDGEENEVMVDDLRVYIYRTN